MRAFFDFSAKVGQASRPVTRVSTFARCCGADWQPLLSKLEAIAEQSCTKRIRFEIPSVTAFPEDNLPSHQPLSTLAPASPAPPMLSWN